MTNEKHINKLLESENTKYFIGGIIAAYAIKKISESEYTRQLAVDITSKALDFQSSTQETIQSIKEDAEDIHEDAKSKSKKETYSVDIKTDNDESVEN
ncbi:MAG: hypothetical protein Q4Q23_00815 [Methanobacteriaceae archaeon]|nr:hypothetical protein [Methanobacteriaceae archaeon]